MVYLDWRLYMKCKVLFFALIFGLTGKCFASGTISVDLGKIQVFTTEAGSRPSPMMKIFGTKVAVVDEMHPEMALALESEVAKQGYTIAKPGEIKHPYSIEEIYAGDADGYNPPKNPESSGYTFPVFQLLGSAIFCGAFHVCNDPSVAANIAAERLNDVTRNVSRDARPDQLPNAKQDKLLVVSKLCTAAGHLCASSIAVGAAAEVGLDELRMANAREGESPLLS
ncbi:hypothetical protein LH425_08855 [Laribacter hongkongensis]|uniref:hypothetical protein n=1 Tax=Laribacter hongkongensis TaxID=168471 RepID=UPI001EFDE413|nr:hypothetical protein [Laribacter hongkongensis]MCG9065147.1 hypothetical protein [Laribacter hongkongensis]